MIRDHMKLVITDDPVRDVKMALAKEHHDRTSLIGRLVNEGHIKVINDKKIRVQIEDEIFEEARDLFPTTELIARIQLALHAGRSQRNVRPADAADHAVDAYLSRGGGHGIPAGGHVRMVDTYADTHFGEVMEQGYSNGSKITAAVKPSKPLRKGLRP